MTPADALQKLIGESHARALLARAESLPAGRREAWVQDLIAQLSGHQALSSKLQLRYPIVGVQEFVESPFFLGKKGVLFPEVMRHLIAINTGDYDEVVCTGGVGSGKTTIALYTQAYQLYILSCMRDPHRQFGLDPSAAIVIVFQSLNATKAEELDYDRFKSMVETSPYFREKFPFNKDITSQLEFPNRIVVKPVSGLETATIGEDVIGGLIDEINFMAVIERSKQADGGTYDQATALYNSIARRRQSRFMNRGKMPGRLCLVSSRKTPGQFTDKKEEEAKTNPRIYIYDKRVWDVKPGNFLGVFFPIFLGDGARQPRILEPDEEVADEDRHLIDHIPIEYRQSFEDDISKAIRDIAGKSTRAIHPYMPLLDKVVANFGKRKSIFVDDVVDFAQKKVQVRKKLVVLHPDCPRWVHIDLGKTSDHAGVAISHCPGFKLVDRGEDSREMLPLIEVDGFLEVPPPRGGEIDFASIRRVLYRLRDMGLPIKWVSMDSFESTDSMQILRTQGFVVGYQSVDTTMLPYDLTKQALYDGRVIAPDCKKVKKELSELERDFKTGKVDHPARGSKDVADAFAGTVFGLVTRREIWGQFSIPITQAISMASIIRETNQERG